MSVTVHCVLPPCHSKQKQGPLQNSISMSGQFGTLPSDNNLNFYDIRLQFSHNSQIFYEKCQNSDVYCFFWQTKSWLDSLLQFRGESKRMIELQAIKLPRQEYEWKRYLKFFMAINLTITSSLWFIGGGSFARRQTRAFREQCFFKPSICVPLILFEFCRILDDKESFLFVHCYVREISECAHWSDIKVVNTVFCKSLNPKVLKATAFRKCWLHTFCHSIVFHFWGLSKSKCKMPNAKVPKDVKVQYQHCAFVYCLSNYNCVWV